MQKQYLSIFVGKIFQQENFPLFPKKIFPIKAFDYIKKLTLSKICINILI